MMFIIIVLIIICVCDMCVAIYQNFQTCATESCAEQDGDADGDDDDDLSILGTVHASPHVTHDMESDEHRSVT